MPSLAGSPKGRGFVRFRLGTWFSQKSFGVGLASLENEIEGVL